MGEVTDGLCVEDDAAEQKDRIEGAPVDASWPFGRTTDEETQSTTYHEDKRDASIREEISQHSTITLVN